MNLAVIILAAGYSSRMSAFKPLLPVGGQSAVSRAASLAARAGVSRVTVVTGFRGRDVEAELRRSGHDVHTVYNARHDEGMMSSVRAGARALPRDVGAFFLLPVDCCAVSPDTLRRIAEALTPDADRVILPLFRGGAGHPPLIPVRLLDGMEDFDGEGGMRAYLAKFRRLEIPVDDPGILEDMDTPADYARLLRALGLPTYPDERDALALLESRSAGADVVRHSRAVADLACLLGESANRAGAGLDVGLLRSAGLLHDICRGKPEHDREGLSLLLSLGYPDAAIVAGAHMELPPGHDAIDETALVYLADKLCRRDGIVPLETTRSEAERRFVGDPAAAGAARSRILRAMAISRALKERCGTDAELYCSGHPGTRP
ncbi:MAG: NTP transferase domain-containing protein [Oscillospiraceae bacterium]|nr:NTP transferase domain-containing protein [Oscillospiraceae bacterium]